MELTFKTEAEMLEHPAVVKYIDEKITEAEQDLYDQMAQFKGMLISQLISIGLESGSFHASGVAGAIKDGTDEDIKKAYDALVAKFEKRTIDSLADMLSDVNELYMQHLKSGSDSVSKKLATAMGKELPANDKEAGKEASTSAKPAPKIDDKVESTADASKLAAPEVGKPKEAPKEENNKPESGKPASGSGDTDSEVDPIVSILK